MLFGISSKQLESMVVVVPVVDAIFFISLPVLLLFESNITIQPLLHYYPELLILTYTKLKVGFFNPTYIHRVITSL